MTKYTEVRRGVFEETRQSSQKVDSQRLRDILERDRTEQAKPTTRRERETSSR